MEIRQLQSFVTITQTESFSAAAERMGYSQSAVTVQIRLLEEELGVRLFERMNRRVYLTAVGRTFLEYAEQVLHDAAQAKEAVQTQERQYTALHIGTLESLCFSRLPEILRCFREKHPQVPIKVTTAGPNELIERMEHNQLDLIYILDRQRYSENWQKVMEVEEPIVFVASPLYGFAQKKRAQLAALLEEPFFLTEKNENYRRALDYYLETKKFSLTPFLEISNTEFIIRMLMQQKGISYLPLFTVKEHAKQGELSILDVPEMKLTMHSQLIYHKRKWVSREMDALIALFMERFGQASL